MDSSPGADFAQPAAALDAGPMPLLGFGTWRLDDAGVVEPVSVALEVGYRHLDTATMYRNEAGIGRALASAGLPRESVFVTTKLPSENGDRARETLEKSLSALGLDHVDLWLIHSPPRGADGASVGIWEHFVRARADGLARSIGVSNYSLDQIDELTRATGVTPAVNQIRWSPSLHDPAVAGGLEERGVVLEGYSPFKAGGLSDPVITGIADELDATPAQVVVAWHVAHGYVVIPKSARRERIEANAAGARLTLSGDQVAAVDVLGRG